MARGPKRTPRPEPDDANGTDDTAVSAPPEGRREGNGSSSELKARNEGASAPVAPEETARTATVTTPSAPSRETPARRGKPGDEPVRRRKPRPTGERPRERDEQGRRKGRRVRRVVRRIDLWSVLKLAVVLYTCLYAAVMATLAVLWGLAYSSGQIEKIESFMADVGMDNYRFYGDQMWRAAAMIGAIGVLAATVITVLTAALVNVISEMTGGIRVVVIEEDPPPRRR